MNEKDDVQDGERKEQKRGHRGELRQFKQLDYELEISIA